MSKLVDDPGVSGECGMIPSLPPLPAVPAMCQEQELMAQDQWSIVVIDTQVGEYENILFKHPQEHFWLVTLAQGNAHARWIISCVGGYVNVTYVLVSKPAPGRLLGNIIGHTKVLPIDLMK